MIIATAGHIDHGKTSLVKALTGVDTDRLPEEKARGLSIDLGFAYRQLAGGQLLGFVDVPGHERFIHNMLAGVAGIDLALLVVAADDGVMPQTREHLAILELFGVPAGLAVISKIDRVETQRVAEVKDEVAALLAATPWAGAPVLVVSTHAGAGVPGLLAALEDAATACQPRYRPGRGFRLTIDRSFSAPGSGTVVTGTVTDGEVAVGDRLVLSPGGQTVRVRGIHRHGQATERAHAGERCALNIAGADPGQAGRGQWLVAPHAHAPTQRLDGWVRALPSARKPLKHWDPVHVHMGTADVLARLVMPGQVIAPGAAALIQVVLEHPVAAVHGDRFVLRDPSARHTLGGGSVVDPFALPQRGRREARAARLTCLQEPQPAAAWQALLDQAADGVAVQPFRRTFNLTPAAMAEVLSDSAAILPGSDQGSAFSARMLQQAQEALSTTLGQFHRHAPQAAGMDTDRLLRSALPRVPQRERLAILRGMAAAGALDISGSLVRMPGYLPPARAGDERLWQRLAPLYADWGLQVPLLREVAARSGVAEGELRDFLKHRTLSGAMVRVAPERFLPRPGLADLAGRVVRLARQRAEGSFSIGEYRDFSGIGRNLAIEVLEYFDRLGLTRRSGPTREIRCLDEGIAASLQRPDWRPPRFTAEDAKD